MGASEMAMEIQVEVQMTRGFDCNEAGDCDAADHDGSMGCDEATDYDEAAG
jgi:hypothetical protein